MNINKAKEYAEQVVKGSKASEEEPEVAKYLIRLIADAYCAGDAETKALDAGYEGTFGQAVESLKKGCKVARKGWNGKGMWLWLKPGTDVKAEWCHDEALKEIAVNNGGSIEALGTICIKTADNKILSGWNASQLDILAKDWVLVL